MIASQAAAEGRIAGMNLYGLRQLRYNAGSVSIYASEIDGLAFGVAGLTQHQAEQEGFPILIGEARLPDRHPASMPNTTEIYCRIIFAADSLQILGGQILGGATTGELVNTIGLAIQMHASAPDLASMQFGIQPRLTPSLHPLVVATGGRPAPPLRTPPALHYRSPACLKLPKHHSACSPKAPGTGQKTIVSPPRTAGACS